MATRRSSDDKPPVRARRAKAPTHEDDDRGLAAPAAPVTIDTTPVAPHTARAMVRSEAGPPATSSAAVPAAAVDEEDEGPGDPEAFLGDIDEELSEDEDDESGAAGPVLDVQPTSPSAAANAPSGASLPVQSAGYGRSSATLQSFLREVGRYPILTLEEEQTLTNAVHERNDPVAARKLVVHNLRLVVKMAYKYRRAWANVLDLIQEGNIGLMEAVTRFDPFKGARFSTYAAYWIRAYMIRYLLEHSRMVRISRTRAGRKLFFRLSKERERMRAMGIEPGPKLLAERLGVSEEDFEEVVRHMDQPEIRLDAPLSYDTDGGDTVLDTLHAETTSPELAARQSEFTADVASALDSFAATLTDVREKAAWTEHMMAEDPLPLSALGERFGVTKQRMGQIVIGIRKRLKTHLVATLGPDVQLDYTPDLE
jgi:RNA polymerase sigma-32 factor